MRFQVLHVCRNLKRLLDPLKLELQAVVSQLTQLLGTELKFSARTAYNTLSVSEHLSGPRFTCA